MTLTLQQLYEEYDQKVLTYRIIIGGAELDQVVSLSYGFDMGVVSTATIVLPTELLPAAWVEEAAVQIFVGFRMGLVSAERLVMGGAVVDSVSPNGPNVEIAVVQDGPRRLSYSYNRSVDYDFDNVLAADAAAALLDLAGVPSYFVDLETWDIGTAVPQRLQFTTYGDAVNQVATVDASPWYAMPSGQVRVELRDPIPADSPRRTYYAGNVAALDENQRILLLQGLLPTAALQPGEIDNEFARPRILACTAQYQRQDVGNFIEVDGAVVHTLGPSGEDNSSQIVETVDGLSGLFPNGARWIPTPPLFQGFTLSNSLIDTDAKAFEVAERYFTLKNRLLQQAKISVPVDPDVFLGETIRVIDPVETGINELYMVVGYRTTIDAGGAATDLTLSGGAFAGTSGFAAPFADFNWTFNEVHHLTGGGNENLSKLDLGPEASMGAKVCQDLPAEAQTPDSPTDPTPGNPITDRRVVFITYNGTDSQDFDGQVVSWTWSDDVGHTGSGAVITMVYDPDVTNSTVMTLTVEDDSGRTATIAKTVYTSDEGNPAGTDPTQNDNNQGGGVITGPCSEGGASGDGSGGTGPGGSGSGPGALNGMGIAYYVSTDKYMMGSFDNRTWNDLAKDDVSPPVGQFTAVSSQFDYATSTPIAIFGTDDGEIVKTTDGAVSGARVFQTPASRGPRQITTIKHDDTQMTIWAGTGDGRVFRSDDQGDSWTQHAFFAGHPIAKILTPADGSLWVFGGDASQPSSLIRIDQTKSGNFRSLTFGGAFATALAEAAKQARIFDITCLLTTAAMNSDGLLLGFQDPIVPLIWSNADPVGNPTGWVATDFAPSGHVNAIAPAQSALAAVDSTNTTSTTQDNETFTDGNAAPSNIKDVQSEGLKDTYVAVTDDGVLKSADGGGSSEGGGSGGFGFMRPNATFGNTWPADAGSATGISVSVGPRASGGPTPPPTQHWVSLDTTTGILDMTDHDALIVMLVASEDPSIVDVVNCTVSEIGQGNIGLATGDRFAHAWYLRNTGPGASFEVAGAGVFFAGYYCLHAELPIVTLTPDWAFDADFRDNPPAGVYNLFADASVSPPIDSSDFQCCWDDYSAINISLGPDITWELNVVAQGPKTQSEALGPVPSGDHTVTVEYTQTGHVGDISFNVVAFTAKLAVS